VSLLSVVEGLGSPDFGVIAGFGGPHFKMTGFKMMGGRKENEGKEPDLPDGDQFFYWTCFSTSTESLRSFLQCL
jgi:hypothetical protein